MGKLLLAGPDHTIYRAKKRIEFPLPTLKIIPSSIAVLIFEVMTSVFIIWAHVPSLAFLKFTEDAFRPLSSYIDMRILFHRVLFDSE